MPNWCENELRISHVKKYKMQSILNTVKDTINNVEGHTPLLQSLIPMPKYLEGTTSPSDSPNWYQWRLANWGVKWDITQIWGDEPTLERDEENGLYHLEIGFDSPWGPPVEAYYKLEKMGFQIYATFLEAGCDFVGRYENGIDTTYSLDDVPKEDRELYDYVKSWRAED